MAGAIPLYYGNNSKRIDIPKNMYIDLRNTENPQELIDNMSIEDLKRYKHNIVDQRVKVLNKVSGKQLNINLKL